MDLRQQIRETPGALRETFEKCKPEFEEIIRRVRWGEGPIFVVGTGSSYYAGLSAELSLESLLGWPIVARPALEFETYTVSVLRQRSVVLAVSDTGEDPETISAARASRARGAVILAFTNNPASELAQTADLAFLTRAGTPGQSGFHTVLCQHAALGYLSLLAARILKRHHQQLEILDQEYSSLAGHIESIPIHLSGAVAALARELTDVRELSVVGGGFYSPVAMQAADWMRQSAGLEAWAINLGSEQGANKHPSREDHATLIISGSHDRLKKSAQALAHRLQGMGVKTFAVTDGNHRDLAQATSLSILIPGLSEMVGASMTLALLATLADHLARSSGRSPKSRPPMQQSPKPI